MERLLFLGLSVKKIATIESNKTKCCFFHRLMLLLPLCTLGLAACDSGDIYPEQHQKAYTYTVSVSVAFGDVSTVPVARMDDPNKFERKLVLAAYADHSETPISLTHIKRTEVTENVTDTFRVLYVTEAATLLRLAITDQSNQIIYTLSEVALPNDHKDVVLDFGHKKLVSFGRLQQQLLDRSCITCHKASDGSAGLSLDAASSYEMMVNKTSTTDASINIVEPYSPNASMIYKRLTDETIGHYHHTTLSTLKENDIELLRVWIINGAKQD